MPATLYGINNCDTCRKARRWLDNHSVDYRFHDLREDGAQEQLLRGWLQRIDWQTLLNRRSATWRGLDAAQREPLDEARAITLMSAYPTLIKRPVLAVGEVVLVGFSESQYQAALEA